MTDRPRVDILNFNFFDWDGERVLAGGAERYVLELARVIGALGAQPQIVQNANRYFYKVYHDVPVLGVPASPSLDLNAISEGFNDAVKGAALVIASPMQLARRIVTDAPIIGINHGIHWDYPNNRLDLHDFALDRDLVDAVLACDVCVSVDTNFFNWVRCFDADAASRIRYVPNFVDLARFRAVPKSFDAPRLELVFPRRLCIDRGFRVLVEAFDHLLPRWPALYLHLCGTGPSEDEAIARDFIARHPRRVRWSKLQLDEMPAAYRSSHVVLVPTVAAEGTSLSAIEGMATNNAIVVTPVGGLPNLVVDGYNGVIAAPGPQGLVKAVERLVQDRGLIERLARNALTVVPAFAREHWSARWVSLLGEHLPSERLKPNVTATPLPSDPYAPVAWPFGLEGELETLRAAHAFTEAQLVYRDSELSGIKDSTGWALLQALYKVRFALFPRGSRTEAAAKWMMRGARALRGRAGRAEANDALSPRRASAATLRNAGEPSPFTIVCLPSIEWTFRVQRPQQLAREFARRGHRIIFAKTQFGAAVTARSVETGIDEVELCGPTGTNPYRDALDADAAARMADRLLEHLAGARVGRFVCVVQLPFWAGVAERLRQLSGCDVVYDCMDLHAGFSSNTALALADEERLVAASDLVVCASQYLMDEVASKARAPLLVRNGVDYAAFASVPVASAGVDGALTVGYYGAIADWFDSELVAAVARERPHWRIVLIGSTWSANTGPLEAASNVELAGEMPYEALPA